MKCLPCYKDDHCKSPLEPFSSSINSFEVASDASQYGSIVIRAESVNHLAFLSYGLALKSKWAHFAEDEIELCKSIGELNETGSTELVKIRREFKQQYNIEADKIDDIKKDIKLSISHFTEVLNEKRRKNCELAATKEKMIAEYNSIVKENRNLERSNKRNHEKTLQDLKTQIKRSYGVQKEIKDKYTRVTEEMVETSQYFNSKQEEINNKIKEIVEKSGKIEQEIHVLENENFLLEQKINFVNDDPESISTNFRSRNLAKIKEELGKIMRIKTETNRDTIFLIDKIESDNRRFKQEAIEMIKQIESLDKRSEELQTESNNLKFPRPSPEKSYGKSIPPRKTSFK
jgi:hypothetical protein